VKSYLLLLLAVFLILLLLPLPALGILADKPAPASAAAPPSAASGTPAASTTAPTAAEDTFRILDAASSKVVVMSARDFLIGTLAAEMYPTYAPEALKAQAVASYTYYSYERSRARQKENSASDFSDVPGTFPSLYTVDGMKARWGADFDAYYQNLSDAVDAVSGKLILYDGQPIRAMYHAISGPMTEDPSLIGLGDYPYLKPVAATGDDQASGYQTTVSFTPDELENKLGTGTGSTNPSDTTSSASSTAAATDAPGGRVDPTPTSVSDPDPSSWFSADVARTPSGTVTDMVFRGAHYTGTQLRAALGLRSADFTVAYDAAAGTFTFTVLGYGHDLGMSQYGADALARQGKSWEDILHYYFTGVTIQ